MSSENQKFIEDLTVSINRNIGNRLTPEIGVSFLNMVQEHLLSLEHRDCATSKEVTEQQV
jgi:hypothetical protein